MGNCALIAALILSAPAAFSRAAAPVRQGHVIVSASQFLAALPEGDVISNGPQMGGGGGRGGGGGGRGRGAASAPASAPAPVAPTAFVPIPPPAFVFENLSITLRVADAVTAKADIPTAGTWHLYVRSRSTAAGSSFKVSVGDKPSTETFGTSPALSFQSGGSFNLPAGPLKISLTDIKPGSAVDVVILSPKSDLKESDLAPLQYPEDLVLLKEYKVPVQVDGVKFGDLNGDGKTDFVILTPNYSCYAYDNSGTQLWHYEAPQAGTTQRSEFEAPGNVWDFDQDGKAEVVAWRMIDGKEYITMADGVTGDIKFKADWPTQPFPHVYNNFRTAIAKLHPGYPDSLIVYTDPGGTVSLNAYGPKLEQLWSYSNPRLKDYHGHYIYPVDINNDGIDEVYLSHVMLDAKGKELWNNYEIFPDNHDHVDSARLFDVDGDGKLEIVAGQSDVGAVLYDATTGKLLWQRFANHTQKVEAGPYRADVSGNVIVASSRYYSPLGALLRWFEPSGKRISIWPTVPIPGNPNFVKGDFKGDGKNQLFWQRFRIEPDGTGTVAFPDEAFHMFDFMGTGTDQVITVASRGSVVRIYGAKGAPQRAPSPAKLDPVYRAHSVSNHTHY